MAIETLRRCLETGDSTGGEEALERVTLRLLDLVSELAQLKRERSVNQQVVFEADLDQLVATTAAEDARREPHAEERRHDADDDGSHEAALRRRDE